MATGLTKSERMERKAQRTSPVRLTEEATRWARIAASYNGEFIGAYVSRVVLHHAKADVEQAHAAATAEQTPKANAPKEKKGKP